MLSNFKYLTSLSSQVAKKCDFNGSFIKEKVQNGLKCFFSKHQSLSFHTDTPRNKYSNILEYRKAQKAATSKIDVKDTFNQDISLKREEGYFPTVDLPNTLFNEVTFKNLPIVHVRVSRNNTIMTLSDRGVTKLQRSCGVEGFKNARKGTNIAAQATGTSFAMRAVRKGFHTVRVIIDGLGPGRLSSIKGLQLGGVKVISVTDNTTYETSLRPRKQRRL